MDSVAVDGNTLEIDGTTTEFEYEIGETVVLDDVVVVRLDVPPDEVRNRNVVAVDETGTERWTIREPSQGSSGDNPYMNIGMEDGELWAGTWHGTAYRVDVETGDLLNCEFRK